MARATKVIQLPAPYQPVPSVTGWGVGQLQFDPLTERATVQLVAVDATGERVAGGASMSFGVTGAQYRALFASPTGATVAAALVNLVVTAAQAANRPELAGATVVDAEAPQ